MPRQVGFLESLSFAFFTFFLFLAWLRPLDWSRRMNATLLGLAALLMLSLAVLINETEFVVFRRILPLILIPLAYWQTGQFTAPINVRLQRWLAQIDQRVLGQLKKVSVPTRVRRWMAVYLEYSYMLVYPMVPSGLAVLYFAGAINRTDEFWTVVLPPAYLCYATLPFVRTLPPRRLEAIEPSTPSGAIRALNLEVVRLVTHEANTFPSGHAATATAVALVLLRVAPDVGVVYVILALSVCAGAFAGRYHYALDVVLGAALAIISFLVAAVSANHVKGLL